MIVLDTNVNSEAMKPEPHLSVQSWLNDQADEDSQRLTATSLQLRPREILR